MSSIKGPSETAKTPGHAMNANLLYLRTSVLNISGGDSRRRRRATSRVLRSSRGISITNDVELPSNTAEWSFSRLSRPIETIGKSITKALPGVRPSAASLPVRGLTVEEKQSSQDCEYFTLKPLYSHLPSCPDLSLIETAKRSSFVSPSKSPSKQRISESSVKQPLESVLSSSSLTPQTDWSDDILCTDEDDDTLPPYNKIVPQMFYRFAGISQYSNSNQLQSRDDFKQLIKCLGMEPYLEDFLLWFPKPKLIKTNLGYITFDMFCDLFSPKFAQTILESRWQYETLCSAIMTMKCLDKKRLNRIEFPQFLRLYRALYDRDISVEKVSCVFSKYDLDGIGLLTIVNIFNFCCEEDLDLE